MRISSTKMFAVYTLGGEYGHITRACTLAAELSQARPDLATKLYLPEHGEGWARRLGLAFSCVPENVRCRRDLLSDWVAEALEADKPEVLIVDCFPIGLLGELESLLPSIKKKVFLTRWLHPRYISKEINRQTLQSFSLRLCTESLHRGFDHRGFENVGPILPCPPEEVLTRKEARLALGLDQDALIVWHQTTKSKTPGHYQEILETRSEELGYQLLQISPGSDLSQRAIPPARYLRAANLFVGQSGHQSYYEVIQAGVPAAFFPVVAMTSSATTVERTAARPRSKSRS